MVAAPKRGSKLRTEELRDLLGCDRLEDESRARILGRQYVNPRSGGFTIAPERTPVRRSIRD